MQARPGSAVQCCGGLESGLSWLGSERSAAHKYQCHHGVTLRREEGGGRHQETVPVHKAQAVRHPPGGRGGERRGVLGGKFLLQPSSQTSSDAAVADRAESVQEYMAMVRGGGGDEI